MIPTELLELPQWVLWRYEDRGGPRPTKPPYNARTGHYASTADPSTWSDYATVYATFQQGGYDGIGFVLTTSDPYTFIDWDDGFYDDALLSAFNTYTEVSPSGKGLHLVCRGNVAEGRKRKPIEIYSSGRYMTMTGNNWPEYRPIRECNGELHQLWESLREAPTDDDARVYTAASTASNSEKFLALWSGRWREQGYPSQSEADFALLNILQFYTKDKEQIHRLFLQSGLGHRDKAKRKDYILPMIERSFDQTLPDIPQETIEVLTREIAREVVHEPIIPKYTYQIVPPGRASLLFQYFWSQSPKPTFEVSLAGTLALLSGVCGRNWNVRGQGLNNYYIVLAETGIGKEAATSAISKAVGNVIHLSNFIGPSRLESGQGLVKHLTTHPCILAIQGEFGHILKNLALPHPSPNSLRIMQDLLDVYGKSGKGQTLGGSARAKTENSSKGIESPAFSILAESSPGVYLESITIESLQRGLLPRFVTFSYQGGAQETSFEWIAPPMEPHLIEFLSDLCTYAVSGSIAGQPIRVIEVAFDSTSPRVWQDYEHYNVEQRNKGSQQAKEMYSRATMKATKLAGLLAVCDNYLRPVITRQMMEWAIEITNVDTGNVIGWFEHGDVGLPANEKKQHQDMHSIIAEYYTRGWEFAKGWRVKKEHWDAGYISYDYIRRKAEDKLSFKSDAKGYIFAVQKILQDLVDGGQLAYEGPKTYRAGPKKYKPYPIFYSSETS